MDGASFFILNVPAAICLFVYLSFSFFVLFCCLAHRGESGRGRGGEVWVGVEMTEYKKLCAMVEKLREESALIRAAFESGDEENPNAVHALSTSIQSLITNAQPRLLKILRKALETDPNRQIYNEKMCAAIQLLFDEFCDVVGVLFEGLMSETLLSEATLNFEECPSLLWAEKVYDCHLLRVAHTEAWKKRLATNIADLVVFEEETRAVYAAEEKQARDVYLRTMRSEKATIQELLNAREAAKWEAEVRRRGDEHQRLATASSSHTAADVCRVLSCVPEAFRGCLAMNMLRLVKALRTTPEDPNIRRIRCNNMRVMTEYGHVALCSGCQTCRIIHSSAEVLWYMMGYKLEYSTSPVCSLRALIDSSAPILLPCGSPASAHTVTPIGYEDYSERFFTLCEPDPAQRPEEWTRWYATLGAMAGSLEDCRV